MQSAQPLHAAAGANPPDFFTQYSGFGADAAPDICRREQAVDRSPRPRLTCRICLGLTLACVANVHPISDRDKTPKG